MTNTFKQYLSIKRKYPEALLLFRGRNNYPAINDDAVIVAKHTSITVEKEKNNRNVKAVAKVPPRSIDSAMRKLIKAGYKVALCDQLETPREGKGKTNKVVNR